MSNWLWSGDCRQYSEPIEFHLICVYSLPLDEVLILNLMLPYHCLPFNVIKDKRYILLLSVEGMKTVSCVGRRGGD